MTRDQAEILDDWNDLLNMRGAELAAWIETEASRGVQAMQGDSGPMTAMRVLELSNTPHDALTEAEWAQMRLITFDIERKLAQGCPGSEDEKAAWRYAMMNLGHDPLKY